MPSIASLLSSVSRHRQDPPEEEGRVADLSMAVWV